MSQKGKANYPNGIPEIRARDPVIHGIKYKWELLVRPLTSNHRSASGPQQNRSPIGRDSHSFPTSPVRAPEH